MLVRHSLCCLKDNIWYFRVTSS